MKIYKRDYLFESKFIVERVVGSSISMTNELIDGLTGPAAVDEYCRDRRKENARDSVKLVLNPLGKSCSSTTELVFCLLNKKNKVSRMRSKINRRLQIDAR